MTLIPTHGLRWNFGVLEQRFLRTNGSTEVWVPVPDVRKPLLDQRDNLAAQQMIPGAPMPKTL